MCVPHTGCAQQTPQRRRTPSRSPPPPVVLHCSPSRPLPPQQCADGRKQQERRKGRKLENDCVRQQRCTAKRGSVKPKETKKRRIPRGIGSARARPFLGDTVHTYRRRCLADEPACAGARTAARVAPGSRPSAPPSTPLSSASPGGRYGTVRRSHSRPPRARDTLCAPGVAGAAPRAGRGWPNPTRVQYILNTLDAQAARWRCFRARVEARRRGRARVR